MENTNVKEMEVVVNEEVTQMELLAEGTEYRDIAKKAKELGVNHVGVKKDVLFAKVNEMITKINNGEVAAPVIEQPTNKDENPSGESSVTEEGTRNQERRTVVRVKATKWYEEPGAFPYNKGDVVKIIGGKDLIGRLAYVQEPSAKKNAVKANLIHPVTGDLQKTLCSFDFDRLEVVERNGEKVEQEINETQEAI